MRKVGKKGKGMGKYELAWENMKKLEKKRKTRGKV